MTKATESQLVKLNASNFARYGAARGSVMTWNNYKPYDALHECWAHIGNEWRQCVAFGTFEIGGSLHVCTVAASLGWSNAPNMFEFYKPEDLIPVGEMKFDRKKAEYFFLCTSF